LLGDRGNVVQLAAGSVRVRLAVALVVPGKWDAIDRAWTGCPRSHERDLLPGVQHLAKKKLAIHGIEGDLVAERHHLARRPVGRTGTVRGGPGHRPAGGRGRWKDSRLLGLR